MHSPGSSWPSSPRGRGHLAIVGLLLALVAGLTLPLVASASSGSLTNAMETPDHEHGWIAGSVTWDGCSKTSQCLWEPVVIVKPAGQPCTGKDVFEATELDEGEATSPIYKVWADGGWTENATLKVGGVGFPAAVGQQACLDVYYKSPSSSPRCGSAGANCEAVGEWQAIALATCTFAFEFTPPCPPLSAPAPAGPVSTGSTPAVPLSAPAPPASSTTVTQQAPAHHPLTRAQLLTSALKHCRRTFHRRRRRVNCERRSWATYRPNLHTG
jgi:hypothetical protein